MPGRPARRSGRRTPPTCRPRSGPAANGPARWPAASPPTRPTAPSDLVAFTLGGRLYTFERADETLVEHPSAGPVFDPRPSPDGRRRRLRQRRRRCTCSTSSAAPPSRSSPARSSSRRASPGVAPSSSPPRRWAAAAGPGGRPTGDRIAVARVDESTVPTWWIADPATRTATPSAWPTRPPAPQTPTSGSRCSAIEDGRRIDVNWDREAFPYLARVDWGADRADPAGPVARPAARPGPRGRPRRPARPRSCARSTTTPGSNSSTARRPWLATPWSPSRTCADLGPDGTPGAVRRRRGRHACRACRSAPWSHADDDEVIFTRLGGRPDPGPPLVVAARRPPAPARPTAPPASRCAPPPPHGRYVVTATDLSPPHRACAWSIDAATGGSHGSRSRRSPTTRRVARGCALLELGPRGCAPRCCCPADAAADAPPPGAARPLRRAARPARAAGGRRPPDLAVVRRPGVRRARRRRARHARAWPGVGAGHPRATWPRPCSRTRSTRCSPPPSTNRGSTSAGSPSAAGRFGGLPRRAGGPATPRRVPRRHRRGAGHRLAPVRHPLHRALPRPPRRGTRRPTRSSSLVDADGQLLGAAAVGRPGAADLLSSTASPTTTSSPRTPLRLSAALLAAGRPHRLPAAVGRHAHDPAGGGRRTAAATCRWRSCTTRSARTRRER